MFAMIWCICSNVVDQNKRNWRVNSDEKIQNGREIQIHMNKKQNDY